MRTTVDREHAGEYLPWQWVPPDLCFVRPPTWNADLLRTETAPDFSLE